MARIRLCDCGAPPVRGSRCWACAHEQAQRHRPLGVISWGAAEVD
ncbi:hypothetical protein [Kocuria dechangensis]|nr:hypothetical protein [Kocuria dechangensis]